MKKLTLIAIVAVTFLFGSSAYAQGSLKIGHINIQELIKAMPETDSAQTKLQKYSGDLQDQLEEMNVEFNKKYETYLTKRDSLATFIKQQKEEELSGLQQRIQTFQTNAQQEIEKQRGALFQPIYEKAQKAISDVAKENKFTYILDDSSGVVLFKSDDSQDILPLVKKKLGIVK
jgi:outer membrane protein